MIAWQWVRATLPWVTLVGLIAVTGVEVYGFRSAGLFVEPVWSPAGQQRLLQFGGIYWVTALAVLLVVPWLFTRLASGLLVLVTLVLLPAPVLAVAFLLLSAWSLGSLCKLPFPVLSGLALYLTAMPFVVRLPVNYPWVYAIVLAVPIAIRRPRLRRPSFSALATWPERLAFALLCFVFTIHWFAFLKPEASPDALAMHLAIPADIAAHHMLTFEPVQYIWAVMPMSADLAYAIAYLFGGEHGARLLNLVFFAMLLGLLHIAIRRWTGPATAWLLLALFAATPLALLVTGELFVENLLAVFLLAGLLAVWRGSLVGAGILVGAALATKLGALPAAVLIAVFAALRRPRWRIALAAVTVALLSASPPYVVAWAKTGNPVFPFLNGRFHSPLLPPGAEIGDVRFRQPLTWNTPYDLTFRTDRFYEGRRGSFGFQYLAFLPLAISAVLLTRRRKIIAATAIALGAAFLVLRSEPNARYLYPELPLLTIPVAALLGWSARNHRPLWRGLVIFCAAAALLNIWFVPSSSYWHRDLYGPFTAAQRAAYTGGTAPIRVAIDWFLRHHRDAPILLTSDTAIAGFAGPVYENQWHQYANEQRIRTASDAGALRALLDEWSVRYVLARKSAEAQMLRPLALRELLRACSATEYVYAEFYIARLEPDCVPKVRPAPPREPEITVRPGQYDDFDPVIVYRGEWDRGKGFEEAFSRTASYSEETGAEALLAFEGSQVIWTFAKAPNRGMAEVVIDGVSQGVFDLYSPDIQWRSRLVFAAGAAARHLLAIRVTGRRHAGATASFVDVDSFEVRP